MQINLHDYNSVAKVLPDAIATASHNSHKAQKALKKKIWRSKAYPPAWIEIDLGRKLFVHHIFLTVLQKPSSCYAYHSIAYGKKPEKMKIKTERRKVFRTGEIIRIEIEETIRYIRITTVESISKVYWRDIRID